MYASAPKLELRKNRVNQTCCVSSSGTVITVGAIMRTYYEHTSVHLIALEL